MKRSLKFTSALLLLGPVIVACGGSKGSKDPTPTPSFTPTVTPTGSEPKEVTLNIWHTFGQTIVRNLEKKLDDFAKIALEKEGKVVKFELENKGSYGDLPGKMRTAMTDGSLPAISVAYPNHVADYIYEEHGDEGKYVVNLEKFFNDPKIGFGKEADYGDTKGADDFVEAFLREGQQFVREGTYVLPYMKSSEVMIYNLTAAQRAMPFYDDTIPEGKVAEKIASFTWDELIDFARVCYEHKDQVLSSLQNVVYYDSDDNLFVTHMMQENIPYTEIGEDGKGKILFEPGTEAFDKAKGLIEEYKALNNEHIFITKGGNEGKYASNAFQDELCIFTIGSSGGTGYTMPSSDKFVAAACRVPPRNNNPQYISQGPSWAMFNNPSLSAAKNADIQKWSWKLLKYLTSTRVNVSLCVTGSEGYVPVRTSCYETITYAQFIEEGELYAETALVLQNDIRGKYITAPVFPGSNSIREQMGGVIGTIINQGGSADTLLRAAIQSAKNDIK